MHEEVIDASTINNYKYEDGLLFMTLSISGEYLEKIKTVV